MLDKRLAEHLANGGRQLMLPSMDHSIPILVPRSSIVMNDLGTRQ